ncbi:MAG TPA: hypothetical protein PLA12_11930 [Candidatus Hydrogenedens sp.]|nr:hypothetical protein [Candidatus Hydrogenedens sp.]
MVSILCTFWNHGVSNGWRMDNLNSENLAKVLNISFVVAIKNYLMESQYISAFFNIIHLYRKMRSTTTCWWSIYILSNDTCIKDKFMRVIESYECNRLCFFPLCL